MSDAKPSWMPSDSEIETAVETDLTIYGEPAITKRSALRRLVEVSGLKAQIQMADYISGGRTSSESFERLAETHTLVLSRLREIDGGGE